MCGLCRRCVPLTDCSCRAVRAEVPNSERANLFVRKLRLCSVICDFSDGGGNDRDKEIKRQVRRLHACFLALGVLRMWCMSDRYCPVQTLLELVDYVNSAKQPFVEQIMPEVVAMVSPPLVPFPPWHSFPKPLSSALSLCAFEILGLC